MRKSIISSVALLTAVVVGSIPVTAHAAGGTAGKISVSVGGNCKVYSGQGLESLQEICKKFGITADAVTGGCPGVTAPDALPSEKPQPPATGDADIPETEGADIEEPGTQSPGTGAVTYAEQVAELVNEERAKAGLAPLTVQADITAAADVRAKEIKQQFSHTRPDGSSFSTALRQQGVSYKGSGENIAYGQKSPEQVMNGWMNSSGHRANILNAKFKNIGVGYYRDERGVNHWVQLFTY